LDASPTLSPAGAFAEWQARYEAAAMLLHSGEAVRGRVEAYYHDYLHRDPDPAGWAQLTVALVQGVRDERLVAAMLGTDEYFARVGNH
jgi:hypothetical protein